MPPFTGVRGTGNVSADQLAIDMGEAILDLQPNINPLLVFSKKLNKKKAVNSDFYWMEDEPMPRFDRINNAAGYTAGDTSLVVDTATTFNVQDTVFVPRTSEMLRVTAVNTGTNTLTVVRGVGSTAAALNDNDELIVVGSSFEEGATSREAHTDNPTKKTNYCQIFRDKVELTETDRSTDNQVSPHDWDRARNRVGKDHALDIEHALWFGKPSKDTSGTHPRRTTGGYFHFATANKTAVGGTLSESTFWSSLRPVFEFGSEVKAGFAAPLVVDVLNNFPRAKFSGDGQARTIYGVRVYQFVSPHGTINLVTNWLFKSLDAAGASNYAGTLAIVDLDALAYRYLAGGPGGSRDTKVLKNRQAPDADSYAEEYLTECGLEFGLAKRHGQLTGITG